MLSQQPCWLINTSPYDYRNTDRRTDGGGLLSTAGANSQVRQSTAIVIAIHPFILVGMEQFAHGLIQLYAPTNTARANDNVLIIAWALISVLASTALLTNYKWK